jgi:Holliday junction resolvasome RuvABC DNA-binding subunit
VSPQREVKKGAPPDLHCFEMKDLLALISEENHKAAKEGYNAGFKAARQVLVDLRAKGETVPDNLMSALNEALYFDELKH